jgi:hypothetical protein
VKKRKNANIFCRVSRKDTRQSILCRVPTGGHLAQFFFKIKIISVECLRSGAQQSNPGHLAKCILKLKKNIYRVPDRGHSANILYISKSNLFSVTHSLTSLFSLTPRRRLSPPPPLPERAAGPPSRRRRPPSCHRRPPSCRRSPFAVTGR